MLKLFFLIILVGSLALLQAWDFTILGVKPNFALPAVVAASFFVANIWESFLLVALSVFILKFAPGFESEIVLLGFIEFASVAGSKYLPWHNFLNNLFLVVAGTLIFYALLGKELLVSIVLLKELLSNIAVGTIIFALLTNLWENNGA